MLLILLDNRDQIVEAINNVSVQGSARRWTPSFRSWVCRRVPAHADSDIRRTIDEIRQPAANVVCGTAHDGGTITGDSSEIVGTNRTIFCNAVRNKPASEVVWTVTEPR